MLTKSLLALSSLLFLACSSVTTTPKVFSSHQSNACHDELEETISLLINAEHLSISKDVFTKSSLLHLTNQQDGLLSPSPIFNDLGGRKTIQLYSKNKQLFVGLLNKDKKISKEKALSKCY